MRIGLLEFREVHEEITGIELAPNVRHPKNLEVILLLLVEKPIRINRLVLEQQEIHAIQSGSKVHLLGTDEAHVPHGRFADQPHAGHPREVLDQILIRAIDGETVGPLPGRQPHVSLGDGHPRGDGLPAATGSGFTTARRGRAPLAAR